MEKALLLGTCLLVGASVLFFAIGRQADDPGEGVRERGATEHVLPACTPLRNSLERTQPPVREPRYEGGPAVYCQLALGKSGQSRHWLALSGQHLHVDLDGDGDLTEAGERIVGTRGEQGYEHEKIVLRVESRTYMLSHEAYDSGNSYLTLVDPLGRTWGAWGDERAHLRFAEAPAQAPIIYFDGPLEMGIEAYGTLVPEGNGEYRISAGVGCRGRGPGSFAHLREKWVPDHAVPEAVVQFPCPTEGGRPIVVELDLDQRC